MNLEKNNFENLNEQESYERFKIPEEYIAGDYEEEQGDFYGDGEPGLSIVLEPWLESDSETAILFEKWEDGKIKEEEKEKLFTKLESWLEALEGAKEGGVFSLTEMGEEALRQLKELLREEPKEPDW